MNLFVCGLFVMAGMLTSQQWSTSQEKTLRQRVELFYSIYSSDHQEPIWDMLSTQFRKQHGNDREKYIHALPKSGEYRPVAHIKDLTINGKKAIVNLRISAVMNNGEEIGWEDHKDSWVLERGRWRFAGSETLDYKKVPSSMARSVPLT